MEDSKWNYMLMFIDSILFANAMLFLSINNVLTYFLNNLGASTAEISLANAVVSIGAFVSQPLFSKKAMKLQYKKSTFCRILSFQRFLFLAFVFAIPMFASSKPKLMIGLFLVSWSIFTFFTGSYGPFYMSLLAKMVPGNKQSRLIGFSSAAGNIIAIGAAYIVDIFLKDVPFPYNYTLLMGTGIIILLLDVLDFALMREKPDIIESSSSADTGYIKRMPRVLKENKAFRSLVLGNMFIVASNAGLAYYVLYSIKTFHIGGSQVALFSGITVVVNTLAAILIGLVADWIGHRTVLKLGATCNFLAGIIIVLFHNLSMVYVCFILSNLCSNCYYLCCNIVVIKNSPKSQVPMYSSINSMITLLASSFIIILSGSLIDKISFTPVFILVSICALCAFFIYDRSIGGKPAE